MNKLILGLYDFLRRRPAIGWSAFLILTAGLVWLLTTLSYKEDISDFLPLDEENQTALSVYQDISGANNIYAIIASRDTTDIDQQELVDGVETFVGSLQEADTTHLVAEITKEVDMDRMMEVAATVYDNIPYFLTDEDFARIDSVLSRPGYVPAQIAEDKQMLLFPSSNILSQNISRDPLNLFTPVLNRLKNGGMSIQYETYDSYILTPDGTKAIAIIRSSFGANESENNAKLVALLDHAADSTERANKNLDVHVIGGPAIAVANATQIKHDSILAVCIAGILILALLIYVFRNARNILLIFVSVGWGWLFAMGGIALLYDSVSIIVIGIASVILGIAINYPLHLIDHLKDSDHPRAALREIIAPLVTGNITTVGAFLCLVPLNAPALHDLGLFSSMLLIGTILFVLIFLPHVVRTRKAGQRPVPEPRLITAISRISLENSKWVIWCIVALTAVFGFFSFRNEFDSDMRNINYMTDEQRADFSYFKQLFNEKKDTETVYVVSSSDNWEKSLEQNELIDRTIDSLVSSRTVRRNNAVSAFLTSKETQKAKLDRWKDLLAKHRVLLSDSLSIAAAKEGFSADAFSEFEEIITTDYAPKEFGEFRDLVSTVFVGNVSEDKTTGRKSLVQTLTVKTADIGKVKEAVERNREFGGMFFDVKSMNGSIANTLSDDFNYIGVACGCIVFFFLWFSFGSIELAIVSFLPMAVSWVWILGIMAILGIKFNIVNIILATFIFGQGDDYTIFMTEGLSYEYAYRKKLLASYKNSIIISALIMFIGIGTLIFAKHPAMRSLGEVTVVGMLSVVLMAYLFPPLVFNWLVRKDGKVRYRPVTLKKLLCTGYNAVVFLTQLLSGYMLGFFLFVLTKPTDRKRAFFHRYSCSMFRWDIKRMAGIKYRFRNDSGEDFDRPAVIICNHQSILDSFCMMTLSPKIILIANEHIRVNPVVRVLFKWMGFISVKDGKGAIEESIRPWIEKGYSVAIFPEGERPQSPDSRIGRFHKGAFYLAEELRLDIVPVYFGGIVELMPKGSAYSNGGPMYIEVGKRIPYSELQSMGDLSDQAKTLRHRYEEKLRQIRQEIFTPKVLADIVYDKYRYKGRDIERQAKRNLKRIVENSETLLEIGDDSRVITVTDDGQGELALMLSQMYPERQIRVYLGNEDSREILRGCIDGFARNIEIATSAD